MPDADGPMMIRDIGGATELIFYPMDRICGPAAEAPPDEPPWIDCAEPSHPACECVCALLQ
ncbi:MAG: hypothetical protein U0168_02935 [Nannocystaceae bacterium]